MDILMMVLQCLAAYFLTVSLLLFLRYFYDAGFQYHKKKAIILLLLASIDLLSEILNISNYVVIFTFVGYLITIIYDYRGKKIFGIFRFLWLLLFIQYCVANILVTAAPYFIPNYNMESLEVSFEEELIGTVIQLVCYCTVFLLLYFGLHKKGIFIKCGKRERIFALVYCLLTLVSGALIATPQKASAVPLFTLAFWFVLAISMLPVIVFSLRVSEYYQQRNKQQEVYLQSELEHFRQYMYAQEETRRFRHDIRNNLLCMNEMVYSDDNEKLAQYLKDLLEITDSLSFKYVSGDELLDSILNSKVQQMEQENIRFELDGVLAGGLPWKPMDICAVFANAVDNAIEACQKVDPEKRCISMRIKSTPQFWLISIENSVAEIVDTKKLFQKNGGYTSKSDSARHGIGTYSMKQTVDSYGAIMKAECTDQVFTLEIMIDKSK